MLLTTPLVYPNPWERSRRFVSTSLPSTTATLSSPKKHVSLALVWTRGCGVPGVWPVPLHQLQPFVQSVELKPEANSSCSATSHRPSPGSAGGARPMLTSSVFATCRELRDVSSTVNDRPGRSMASCPLASALGRALVGLSGPDAHGSASGSGGSGAQPSEPAGPESNRLYTLARASVFACPICTRVVVVLRQMFSTARVSAFPRASPVAGSLKAAAWRHGWCGAPRMGKGSSGPPSTATGCMSVASLRSAAAATCENTWSQGFDVRVGHRWRKRGGRLAMF